MNDNLPEITLSPEITDFTAKITTRALESAEDFIFQTIAPFCDRITEQRISKAELTAALMKQRARPLIDDPISTVNRCPGCRVVINTRYFGGRQRLISKANGVQYVDIGGQTYDANYCPVCGQKLDFNKRERVIDE